MESKEYNVLHSLESSYWWFRGMRGVLLDICRGIGLGESSRILDAGCGTGKTVEVLHKRIGAYTLGCDMSCEAMLYWDKKENLDKCVGSINSIPIRNESFDAVLSIDVLECEGVKEKQSISEMLRVLRPGGYLVVVVPAYRFLMSPEHHRAVKAVRRYSKSGFKQLFNHPDISVIRTTHLFGTLLLPISVYRLWRRCIGWRSDRRPRSELRRLNPIINEVLYRLIDWERHLLARMNIPFGSSMLLVARKST